MQPLAFLDSPAAALSLLDAALKGAALLLTIALASLLLRKVSAAGRHLAWSLGAIGLILLPVLSALLPAWQVPVPAAWLPQRPATPQAFTAYFPSSPQATTPTFKSSAPVAEEEAPAALAPLPAAAPVPERPAPALAVAQDVPAPATFPRWPLTLWLAGLGLTLALPLLGLMQIGRLRRRSTAVTDPQWLALLNELRASMGVRRRVRLLTSDRMAMPITWGALRPVLLLPAEAHEWPEDRRRMVLLHELAHIARWDWLTQMLAQMACALHWFNPLVWLASRRMRIEREQACDDLVLAAGSRASDYAAELLQFAHRLHTGSLAAFAAVPMARPSSLEGRLLAILDRKRRRGALTAAAVALGVLLLAAIIIPVAMLRAAEGDAKPKPATKEPAAAPAPTEAPRHEQTRDVLKLWHAEYPDRATVPHEAIVRLASQVSELIEKHPDSAAEAAKLKPLLPRLDEDREWPWAEATKLMDEICDVITAPVGWLELKEQFRAFNRPKAGEVWPAEKIAGIPFGAPVGGLRAAWIFEPRKDAYAIGDVLKGRILFHNAGKAPIEFLTDAWHQEDGWNVIDAAGKKVNVKATWYTGVTPYQRIRLQPGQVAEVAGHAIAIGAGDYAEKYSQGVIGAEMEAKVGDEVRCTWNVSIKASWGQDEKPPAGQPELPNALPTGEVKFRVVAPDPNAAKAPGLATFTGQYDLAPGIKLQVTQVTSGKNGEPTKRTNSATILWLDAQGKETAKHLLELPSGLECYVISWPRGGSALWIGEPDGVRKVDFSEPAKVREAEWLWNDSTPYGDVPADVRALLEKHRPKSAARKIPLDPVFQGAVYIKRGRTVVAEQPGPWRVTGVVTDRDGKFLEGVTVTAMTGWPMKGPGYAMTNAQGRYELDVSPRFPPESQEKMVIVPSFFVRKTGWVEQKLAPTGGLWVSDHKNVQVQRDTPQMENFEMAPAVTLKGRLLGRGAFPTLPPQNYRGPGEKLVAGSIKLDGGALSNWEVALIDPKLPVDRQVVARALTNRDGEFTFPDLLVGTEWQIQADTHRDQPRPVSPKFKLEETGGAFYEFELGEEQKALAVVPYGTVAFPESPYILVVPSRGAHDDAELWLGAYPKTDAAGQPGFAFAGPNALVSEGELKLEPPAGAPPLENGYRLQVSGLTAGREPTLLRKFRVIAGVPSGVSTDFEKTSGEKVYAWQPHTLRVGKDGTILWPMDKAYDQMVLRVEADGYIAESSRLLKKTDGPALLGFTLRPDPGMKGRVLLPNGQPAAGATVALGMTMRDLVIDNGKLRHLGEPPAAALGDEWRKPIFVTTATDGSFTLPTELEPTAAVLIVHDGGVREMSCAKFRGAPEIKLAAWGKIEGRVQWGDVSGANADVELTTFRDDYGYPGIVAQYHKTKADAQGRFTFEKVLPGRSQFSCPIIFNPPRNGVTSVSLAGRMAHYTVRAGEPTRVIIGGDGRTVLGRLTGLASWEGVTLHLSLAAPPFSGGNDATWAAYNEFQNSPSGAAFNRGGFKPAADGTFKIPTVLPGDYTLLIALPDDKGSGGFRKLNLKPEDGHGPPAAEDVGEIKVTQPKAAAVTPGPKVEELPARTATGQNPPAGAGGGEPAPKLPGAASAATTQGIKFADAKRAQAAEAARKAMTIEPNVVGTTETGDLLYDLIARSPGAANRKIDAAKREMFRNNGIEVIPPDVGPASSAVPEIRQRAIHLQVGGDGNITWDEKTRTVDETLKIFAADPTMAKAKVTLSAAPDTAYSKVATLLEGLKAIPVPQVELRTDAPGGIKAKPPQGDPASPGLDLPERPAPGGNNETPSKKFPGDATPEKPRSEREKLDVQLSEKVIELKRFIARGQQKLFDEKMGVSDEKLREALTDLERAELQLKARQRALQKKEGAPKDNALPTPKVERTEPPSGATEASGKPIFAVAINERRIIKNPNARQPAGSVEEPAANPADGLERWPVVVIDGQTGKPFPNFAFRAYPRSGETTLTSDAEGKIEVVLGQGKGTTLDPRMPGWSMQQMLVVGNFEPTPNAFLANPAKPDPAKPIRAVVWPGTIVSGRLLEPDGKPVPHAMLEIGAYLNSQQWKERLGISLDWVSYDHGDWSNWSTGVRTAADGSFCTTVPPAEARAWLRVGYGNDSVNYGEIKSTAEVIAKYAPLDLEIKSGEEPVGAKAGEKAKKISFGDIKLQPGVVLRGQVRDVNGEPLHEVELFIKNDSKTFKGVRTMTDAGGSFAFRALLPGTYTLAPDARFRKNGEVNSRDVRAVFVEQTIELPANQSTVALTVQAVPHETLDFEWVDRRAKKGPVSSYGGFYVSGKITLPGRVEAVWQSAVELVQRDGRDVLTVKVPKGLEHFLINLSADAKVTASYDDGETKAGPGTLELADWTTAKRRTIFGDEPK
jgi:beta-lactamase regulating signal transducer with metallopeptidase domain/biopolymer transport protein ExbD